MVLHSYIRRQKKGRGIHEPVRDQDLVVFDRTYFVCPLDQSLQGGTGHPFEKHVHTTHRVQVVVDPFGGFWQRCTVEELERTGRSLYLVRS